MTELENAKKSNKWWPDGPFDQGSLDVEEVQIYQRKLAL